MKQNEYDAATSMQQLVEARPSKRRGRAIRWRGPSIIRRGRAIPSSASAELLSADPSERVAGAEGSECEFVCLLPGRSGRRRPTRGNGAAARGACRRARTGAREQRGRSVEYRVAGTECSSGVLRVLRWWVSMFAMFVYTRTRRPTRTNVPGPRRWARAAGRIPSTHAGLLRVLTLGYSKYPRWGTPSTHALQAGVCYRLYSARTAAALPAHQPAEIHRIGLEQVCLQVRALPGSTPRVPLESPPESPWWPLLRVLLEYRLEYPSSTPRVPLEYP
jgi:hypothetical protein